MQAVPARIIHHDGATGSPRNEGQHDAQSRQGRAIKCEGYVIRHTGNMARHVRGVLVYRQKSACIGGPRHECQNKAKMPVGILASVLAGQLA